MASRSLGLPSNGIPPSGSHETTDPIYLELESELQKLIQNEHCIDQDLITCYAQLSLGKSLYKGGITNLPSSANESGGGRVAMYESHDISFNLQRIEQFDPFYEIISQDSKKLCSQIDECHLLSDRLSAMVRRLDIIQLRAQEALACTEDVINLKECYLAISNALESHNLALAVSYVRQVHDIDEQAARASDDYGAIQNIECQVKDLVKTQFELAIKNSDLEEVLKLCPHLHVMGLERDATELFLDFIESTIFIGITATASPDHSGGGGGHPDGNQAAMFAEILSNIFNTAFTICQRYLPVVIQGLERTQGDILFIRKLHQKCEKEAEFVIRKYLSSRNAKNLIASLNSSNHSLSKSASGSHANASLPSSADMHSFLDEVALLLQYCCSYAKYLKMLCDGAEHRVRLTEGTSKVNHPYVAPAAAASTSSASTVVVFKKSTPFDALQQELINEFYVEGEQWLIRSAVQSFVNGLSRYATATRGAGGGKEGHLQHSLDIDGYFFVFQRCSQRAIATNNIHAACAVLHVLSDHLSTDILQQFSNSLSSVVAEVSNKMRGIMSRFLKSSAWYSGSEEAEDSNSGGKSGGYIPQGLHNALLFASALSREIPGTASSSAASGGGSGIGSVEEGMWGVEVHLEILNVLETCIRYTDRLRREIASNGRSVFGDDSLSSSTTVSKPPSSGKHVSGAGATLSDEMNKLQLCIEDFESCKESLAQTVRQAVSSISGQSQALMKDVISHILSKSGPVGGIRFHLEDEAFDQQPMVQMLPKLLVVPFEVLISISTANLSESNKDLMVGMMVDAYCAKFEHFISQTTFSYAGALKLEECVRALNSQWSQVSTVSLRARFSRLREILIVLTSDVTAPHSSASGPSAQLSLLGLSQISDVEAQAFLVLRTDFKDPDPEL